MARYYSNNCAEFFYQERSLHYGDGLFETMRVLRGRILLAQAHWARLQSGCARLKIHDVDVDEIAEFTSQVIDHHDDAILKVIVTRGCSETRGIRPALDLVPNIYVFAYPWQTSHLSTVSARIADIRLSHQPVLAGIKHLNRLEYVLASMEPMEHLYNDTVLLDAHDNIIEGLQANIFFIRDQQLFTPSLACCGVQGVVRNWVISNAHVPVTELKLPVAALPTMEAAFFTNSIIGIRPIVRIVTQQFNPLHAITQALQAKYLELLV